ncbi:MAG: WD40 repeat domain-containing protein [Candidatus Obscuribacterales bacterium]|nr:WD40 repeat domain-containing protein [Candidatus Obscuribacterales bacterium]
MNHFALVLLTLLIITGVPSPGWCRWFTQEPVTCVRFSPDGKYLLTSGRNNTVGLWNATTGEELKAFRGHECDVLCLAFGRDCKSAASGSADNTVRIWDVDSGRQKACFKGHTSSINSIALSRDGKKVLSGSADGTVKLWDVATASLQHTYTGHTAGINSVAFSIDERRIISAGNDKTIRVWDVSAKAPAQIVGTHLKAVLSISVSPDGKSLVSGGADQLVKFWDLQSGKERLSRAMNLHDVESVSYSPDGKSVAAAGSNCLVRLLDAETGNDAPAPSRAFTVSSLVLTPGTGLKPSPSETSVENGTSQIFCPWSGSLSYSPNGEKIAIGGFGHTSRICDVSSGRTLVTFAGSKNNVFDLAFSPDGKVIASAGEDDTIMLWDANTGRQTASFSVGADNVSRWTDSPVFSPDGSKLYMTTYEDTGRHADSKVVKCWDLKTGESTGVAKATSNHLGKVALSSDGSMFATSTDYANVTLWNATSFEELHRFVGGRIDYARAIVFSPDNSLIASGGWDHTLQIWNRKTGQLMQSLTTYGYTFDAKFSPDGRFLACGGLDIEKKGSRRDQHGVIDPMSLKPPVEVWRVSDGSKVRDLKGPGECDSIVFSPDGKTLIATVGSGTSIYFWDFQSGKVIRTISGDHRHTRRLAISRDGKMLACENGHFIERWDIDTGKLLKTFTD